MPEKLLRRFKEAQKNDDLQVKLVSLYCLGIQASIKVISMIQKLLTYSSLIGFTCIFPACSTINTTQIPIEKLSFIKLITDEGNSRGVTVEELPRGGYILTGYTNDGQYGNDDVLLIKTNLKGEIIWRKTYGGEGEDYGWAVRQTADNGFIIAGYTNSFGEGGMDVYLLKTDADGNTLWSKTFGGEGDEYGWDIRVTRDEGYIIASQTNSFGKGEIDAWLIKTDAKGNEEWSKTYGDVKTDRVFSVHQSKDGGFVAGGISYSFESIGPVDRDGYLIKTDASGNLLWQQHYGENAYDVIHSVALTDDGDIFLTGYGESYNEFGHRDVYLIKTDKKGVIQWIEVQGSYSEERGIKGLQTSDGGFIAIGYTHFSRDMYLVKTNSQGVTSWTRNIGLNDRTDFGYTVRETRDRGFILIGHSEDLQTRKMGILLVKTDSMGKVESLNH